GPPRVRQDRAIAERPWPPLEPPLAPADDLPTLQAFHDALDQALLVVDTRVRDALPAQEALDGVGAVLLPPERVLHHESPRVADPRVVRIERPTARASAVTRRGLNVHLVEGGLSQDPPVGDAVERDPAGHAESS